MQDKTGPFWTLALVHNFMKVKDENVNNAVQVAFLNKKLSEQKPAKLMRTLIDVIFLK